MTRSDRNKHAMYDAVRHYLAQTNEIWKDTPGFSANAERFGDLFDQTKEILQTLRTSTQPTTARKYAQLDELSKEGVILQGAFRTLSIEEELENFDALLKMNLTDLRHGAARQRVINIRHLVEMADQYIEKLSPFGWTPERQSAMTELLETCSNDLIAPTAKRQELKTLREKMKQIFGDIDNTLKALDMQSLEFEKEHPEFVIGWKNGRTIIDYSPGSRSLSETLQDLGDIPLDEAEDLDEDDFQDEDS